MHRHINQSTKQKTEQKTKKSLSGNLSKGLLELEFKQNNQIKNKMFKMDCQKFFTKLQIIKNAYLL